MKGRRAAGSATVGERTFGPMAEAPETRYTSSGGLRVAYEVTGTGPPDLVFVADWLNNVELSWDLPATARYLERLASFSRLILFDQRGTGLSDPVPLDALPTLEEWMDDVRAVSDAAGAERPALLGFGGAGPMCMLYAATNPDRVSAMVDRRGGSPPLLGATRSNHSGVPHRSRT